MRSRSFVSLLLVKLLLILPAHTPVYANDLPKPVYTAMQEALQQPYIELFDTAATLEFRRSQIEAMRKLLTRAQTGCKREFETRASNHEKEVRQAQAELRKVTATLSNEDRREYHCRIHNARILHGQARVLSEHAIPVAYENRLAKLDLIEKWPAEQVQIRDEMEAGRHHDRKFGDVMDIGVRELFEGQEKDVKTGEEVVRQMTTLGLLPAEVENPRIRDYVESLTLRIARHSDLRVPARVTVLNSREINAFALPGGYLYIQRGLLEAVDDESQLAGVIAHEIAHVTGRHSHRLMRRATIASIIYQAAQVAAMILTGGVAGIGTYYALQYGFYGLGLILSLDMLGVSRDFELEADQLGVQYAWNAGFDPNGFIRFFDKMATRVGYVNGASWFRTHPPFYERMVHSKREITFLPPKEEAQLHSSEFNLMKAELAKVTAAAEKEEKSRPKGPGADCPAPDRIEYKPGEPIEKICGEPGDRR
ncbi:MAG: M48 family metalloprotease [Bryobacteraceae bacterium]